MILAALSTQAQGWPENYGGVMLQAFYWDSYSDSKWTKLESQADDLAQTFSLVWIPQSGYCGGKSMGYDDLYWFTNYNSSFGTKTELKSMINTFKDKGMKTIADVVINHRRNKSNWVDFPKETYNGEVYEMTSTDICANDDGGNTLTWATSNGYSLSTNNDTGEGWDGMRDLDHKSENVQRCVKAYLKFLLNDLGYAGFRYDMVKGYSPSFTGMYNTDSQPEFSVGECWDGTTTIRNWINGTKVDGVIQSAAFDFQFRYVVRNAANDDNWQKLGMQNDGNWPLMSSKTSSGTYRRYAVTFVENHDTEWRTNARQDPLLRDTLAANAFMLAMPGTPCVFLKHWQSYRNEIKSMAAVRQLAGITNTSVYTQLASQKAYYAVQTDSRLLAVVGHTEQWTPDAAQWIKVLDGYHYAYYLAPSLQTAWIDKASGTYEGKTSVMLSAVTDNANARIVYTTDGTTPTAQSTAVASGTQLELPYGTTTLKAALLVDGQVQTVIERNYVVNENVVNEIYVPSFCVVNDGETCAFFEAPSTWTSTIKCWAWDENNYTGGTWPGKSCSKLGKNDRTGNYVWKWTYDGTLTTQPSWIIFSNNGSPQTADLPFQNGGYYTIDGFKANVITAVKIPQTKEAVATAIYTIDGRRIARPTKGLNIIRYSDGRTQKVFLRP